MGLPQEDNEILGFVYDWCRDVRLLCLYRFKLWWMMPRVGDSGSDIPVETQMLLLEVKEDKPSDEPNYILFLPLLDGDFRSSLQGNSADELELCIESGIISSQLSCLQFLL